MLVVGHPLPFTHQFWIGDVVWHDPSKSQVPAAVRRCLRIYARDLFQGNAERRDRADLHRRLFLKARDIGQWEVRLSKARTELRLSKKYLIDDRRYGSGRVVLVR